MGLVPGVWTPAGRELVTLEAGRLTLGTDPANDLPLPVDPTLSRLHAVLERYEAGWCVCATWARATAPSSTASTSGRERPLHRR